MSDKSGEILDLLEEVAKDPGATTDDVASSADGGHSFKRSDGRGRLMVQSHIVKLNGAGHNELMSRFMKALESKIQASGFEETSSGGAANPVAPGVTCDFCRSYTEPGGKVGIGEIRIWSTLMRVDRIRITTWLGLSVTWPKSRAQGQHSLINNRNTVPGSFLTLSGTP